MIFVRLLGQVLANRCSLSVLFSVVLMLGFGFICVLVVFGVSVDRWSLVLVSLFCIRSFLAYFLNEFLNCECYFFFYLAVPVAYHMSLLALELSVGIILGLFFFFYWNSVVLACLLSAGWTYSLYNWLGEASTIGASWCDIFRIFRVLVKVWWPKLEAFRVFITLVLIMPVILAPIELKYDRSGPLWFYSYQHLSQLVDVVYSVTMGCYRLL